MGFKKLTSRDVDPVQSAMEAQGYLIEIAHIGSGKMAVFPAWLTDYSDDYTSEWKTERIFGRNDPIGSFVGVSGKINISLEIPSFSVAEAKNNLHQVEHLMANLYPSYKDRAGVDVLEAYPLVKVRFSNLIKKTGAKADGDIAGGLTGWIESVSYSPDLEAGFHHPPGGSESKTSMSFSESEAAGESGGEYEGATSHTFYPKKINISFSLSVVHEHKLGWSGKSWLGTYNKHNYTDIVLSGGKEHDSSVSPGESRVSRLGEEDRDTVAKNFKKNVTNVLAPGV